MSKDDVNYLTKVILRVVGTVMLSIIGFFAVKTYNKIDRMDENITALTVSVAIGNEKINRNRDDLNELKQEIKKIQANRQEAQLRSRPLNLPSLTP